MMIELINVEKMFTSSTGIKNINLSISNQNKIGILGPNGSGKSTLIKLIQGLLLPKSGEITKNGIATKDKNFSLDDVAYISATNPFPGKLSVKRYVNFIKALNRDYKSNIDEIGRIFEFDLKQKTKIKKLSTGMIQKMKICLALGFERKYYILDEPTSGLDPLMREKFINYINHRLQDKIIIYCTHLVEEISQLCKEVLILKNNTIVETIIINEKTNLIENYRKIYDTQIQGEIYENNLINN